MKTLLLTVAALLVARQAGADPLRLRADAFASAQSPVGLLILQAEDSQRDWLDAEALVWTGVTELDDSGTGDALVVTLRARDPKGRGEARVGRFLVASGAIMPRHIDGVSARGRLSSGSELEVFGGLPVVPRFGVDAYSWLLGMRISHRLSEGAAAGLSFVHERERGFIADEEVGFDVALAPSKWLDIAARAALDLVDDPGISEARVSAAARKQAWRFEAFGTRRSPSRLLPATSLFSALGDVPSDEIGVGARWRAAPRLDLWSSVAYRRVEELATSMMDAGIAGVNGYELRLRSALRLDDKGKGVVAFEINRQGLDAYSSWTGLRTTTRLPVTTRLLLASEFELVVPDHSHGRGAVWPWGLVALQWQASSEWEAAAAVEGRASPESTSAVSALLRVARRWGAP